MKKIMLSIATAAAASVVVPQTAYAMSCSSEETCFEVDNTGPAILGTSTDLTGVTGQANGSGDGVDGFSGTGLGGFFQGVTGMEGSAVGSGTGVYGVSTGGHGVEGDSNNSIGVKGVSSGFHGVYGTTSDTRSTSAGVAGVNTGAGYGVYGSAGSGYAGYFQGNVHITGTLTCGVTCNSDRRLKQNIAPLTGALGKLLQLKGVTFEWKNPEEHGDHKGTQTGVIAQDVEKVFPQWVRETEQGFRNVDPDARTVVALTVEGFRELKTENDELRGRVKALEDGRRPMISGFGEGGIGLGLIAVAGAIIFTRPKRSDARR